MALVQIAHNATIAQVRNPTDPVEAKISELLSYMVDGADSSFQVNIGAWDGRSSFYEFTKHTFPAGFVHMVEKELIAAGYQVQIIRKPHATPLGPENPIVDAFGNDNPDYDYQMKALRRVEKHGRGIIQVATGGGKSKIAKLIMSRYRRMTLFLTTRGILLYQMDDQLKEIGLNTGQIGDGEMRVVRGVNLGMVQTLVQALEVPDLDREHRAIVKSIHLNKNKDDTLSHSQIRELAKSRFDEKTKKRNQILKVLELIEVVIGEEAHEAGGDSYFTILQHCKNATIRVALTATPFMRDSASDNMRLMAAFGPVLIKISEKLLIDRGILARPIFKFVNSKPHPTLRKSSPFERAYKFGYVENEFMLADALRDARTAADYGLPTLTLILRKAHGDTVLQAYRNAGMRAEFLKGENDQAQRQEQLRRLADGDLDVLIGTTILDVGVDCPAIALVQLLGGGKAEVALRQRIGRGLRRKKGMANVTFIADYSCNTNTYLSEHARQRRNIIQSTPGFDEGILPDGQDFDWSVFAERKAA